MRKRPDEVITGIRVSSTIARQSLDRVMVSDEFMYALISELKKEAPDFLSPFVNTRAFTMVRLRSGWSLLLHNKKDEGQLLAYWNFGIPHPFRIPKVGVATLVFPELEIFRSYAVHPAVPPDKFISRAWHRVINRYTMRIKRDIENSFRGIR